MALQQESRQGCQAALVMRQESGGIDMSLAPATRKLTDHCRLRLENLYASVMGFIWRKLLAVLRLRKERRKRGL
jgi:hypothetical protein